MKDIVLALGQHRNEKSAYMMGGWPVAKGLKGLGYDVTALKNPEKRTQMEIVLDVYRFGRKINKVAWWQIQNAWEQYIIDRYRDSFIFLFHNDSFVNTKEEDELGIINRENLSYSHFFNEFGIYENDFPADHIKLQRIGSSYGKVLIIEPFCIPTYEIPEEHSNIAREVLGEMAEKMLCWYLHDTDIEKTKADGLMGEEMVQTLVKGIDFLMNDNSEKWFQLKTNI